MEHVWSVLCTRVIIDQQTKQLSFIDAIDILRLHSVPPTDSEEPLNIGPLLMKVAIFWYRSDIDTPETGNFKIKITNPNGTVSREKEVEIDLEKSAANSAIVDVPIFPYSGAGLYHFEVEVLKQDKSWSRVAKLPLQVKLPNQPV